MGTAGPTSGGNTVQITRRDAMTLAASAIFGGAIGTARAASAAGQPVYAVHISLAPPWFDPAETQGIITPYMLLYALHDGLVKPMPGQPHAPCLAQSWSVAE